MGYAFGAAIRIAYCDRDGGDKDGRDDARSAVKSGGCYAAKTNPPPAPTEASEAGFR